MNRIKTFLLTLLVAAFGFATYAQEKIDTENYNLEIPNVPSQGKQHHVKITLINGQKLRAIMTSIGDKSIQLEKVVYRNYRGVDPAPRKSLPFDEINYSDIQDIKIIATFGERIVAFFVGTGLGVVIGGLGGLGLPCDDCTAEGRLGVIVFAAGLGAVVLGPVAAITGMKDRVEIAGQYNKYRKFKAQVEKKRKRRHKKLRR